MSEERAERGTSEHATREARASLRAEAVLPRPTDPADHHGRGTL
jgi:hypothetical protein